MRGMQRLFGKGLSCHAVAAARRRLATAAAEPAKKYVPRPGSTRSAPVNTRPLPTRYQAGGGGRSGDGKAPAMTVATFERHLADLGRGIVAAGMARPYRALSFALKAEGRDLHDAAPMRALLQIISTELANRSQYWDAEELGHLVNFLADDKVVTAEHLRLVALRLPTFKVVRGLTALRLLRGLTTVPPSEAANTPWGRDMVSCLAQHVRKSLTHLESPSLFARALTELKALGYRDDHTLYAALAERFLECLPPPGSGEPLKPVWVKGVLGALAAVGYRSFRLSPGYTLGVTQRALPPKLEAGLADAALRVIPTCDGSDLSALATQLGSMCLMAAPVAGEVQTPAAAATSDRMWLAIQTRCVQLLPRLTALDVVFIGAAFASVTRRVAHEVVGEELAARVFANATASGASGGAGEGAARSGPRSAAELGAVVGDRRFWRALGAAAAVHLDAMRPQHIGTVLASLATAGEVDEALFRDLMRRLRAAVDGGGGAAGEDSLRCDARFGGRLLQTVSNVAWELVRAGSLHPFVDDVAALCSAAARLVYDDTVRAAGAAGQRPGAAPSSFGGQHIEHCVVILRSVGQAAGAFDARAAASSAALSAALRAVAVATALRVNLLVSAEQFPRDTDMARLADTLESMLPRWRWLESAGAAGGVGGGEEADLLHRALSGSTARGGAGGVNFAGRGSEEEGIVRDAVDRLRAQLQRHAPASGPGS